MLKWDVPSRETHLILNDLAWPTHEGLGARPNQFVHSASTDTRERRRRLRCGRGLSRLSALLPTCNYVQFPRDMTVLTKALTPRHGLCTRVVRVIGSNLISSDLILPRRDEWRQGRSCSHYGNNKYQPCF